MEEDGVVVDLVVDVMDGVLDVEAATEEDASMVTVVGAVTAEVVRSVRALVMSPISITITTMAPDKL